MSFSPEIGSENHNNSQFHLYFFKVLSPVPITNVFILERIVYRAADIPAGPLPIIMQSYIILNHPLYLYFTGY